MDARIERSRLVRALYELGPLTYRDAPYSPTKQQRRHYVSNFRVRHSLRGHGVEGILYLRDHHTPVDVVERWVSENQDAIETIGKVSAHHRISDNGEEWRKASQEVFGQIHDTGSKENGNTGSKDDHNTGGVCPMYESEYDTHLPDHLPCDG